MHQLHLHQARGQGIVPQLAGSGLNVVEEAGSGLAISNVKCDNTDLLAGLLRGPPPWRMVVVDDGVVRLKRSMVPSSGRRWRTWIAASKLPTTRSAEGALGEVMAFMRQANMMV